MFGFKRSSPVGLTAVLVAISVSGCGGSPPKPAATPLPTPAPVSTPAPEQVIVSPVSPAATPTSAVAQKYTYTVVNTYPHDRAAFTQGLVFDEAGQLYEGTGLYGKSSLRKVDLQTGDALQQSNLAPNRFGEGITIWGDKIIQLTWKSGAGYVYDKESFELLRQFHYPTEGWGITRDDEKLIMSDGSSTLYFWDPETLAEIGRVTVFDENGPVIRLNELEYVNGEVWANVWQTSRIARINPQTGRVTGWIDMRGLLTAADRSQPVDVLNGIVFNAQTGQLFVTGKLWPKLFEIEVIPVK